MKRLRSTVVSTARSSGAQKLGHPVPLSNFVLDENSGVPQPAHLNVPDRFSPLSALEPGRSVPCSQALPPHRRTNFLRKRLRRGSAL